MLLVLLLFLAVGPEVTLADYHHLPLATASLSLTHFPSSISHEAVLGRVGVDLLNYPWQEEECSVLTLSTE